MPRYECLWRGEFLDSEKLAIRKLGIIADIDVWDQRADRPSHFIEVKAQKVTRLQAEPRFFLSVAEWRSYQSAARARIGYQLWLFQYLAAEDFAAARQRIKLGVYTELDESWLNPDGFAVLPIRNAASWYDLEG